MRRTLNACLMVGALVLTTMAGPVTSASSAEPSPHSYTLYRDGVKHVLPSRPLWGHDAAGRPMVTYTVATPNPAVLRPRTTAILSPAEVVSQYTGITLGPGPNTNYGKATLTRFVGHYNATTGHRWWTANLSIVYVSPYVNPYGVYRARISWWDPTTWLWSHIIDAVSSNFWQNWVSPCLQGIEKGFLGSFGGGLAGHIFFFLSARAEDVFAVTWYGAAITAIGNCAWTITHR